MIMRNTVTWIRSLFVILFWVSFSLFLFSFSDSVCAVLAGEEQVIKVLPFRQSKEELMSHQDLLPATVCTCEALLFLSRLTHFTATDEGCQMKGNPTLSMLERLCSTTSLQSSFSAPLHGSSRFLDPYPYWGNEQHSYKRYSLFSVLKMVLESTPHCISQRRSIRVESWDWITSFSSIVPCMEAPAFNMFPRICHLYVYAPSAVCYQSVITLHITTCFLHHGAAAMHKSSQQQQQHIWLGKASPHCPLQSLNCHYVMVGRVLLLKGGIRQFNVIGFDGYQPTAPTHQHCNHMSWMISV